MGMVNGSGEKFIANIGLESSFLSGQISLAA